MNQQLEQQYKKAKKLVQGVSIISKTNALVQSDSGNVYEVDFVKKTCTCPHHKFRQAQCKHIDAVRIFLRELLENLYEEDEK